MDTLDIAVAAIIGFILAFILQTVLLSKAKTRIVKLLPAIISAVAALLSACAEAISLLTVGSSDFILAAAFFAAGLLGCGAAALIGKTMTTNAAVIVPVAAVLLAVGAVFAAEWRNGRYSNNWDLQVRIDEITASENGDLSVAASGVGNGAEFDGADSDITGDIYCEDEFYSLFIPAKLAEKYNLYEGMVLNCNVKEESGKTTVTKIDGSYEK